MHALMKRWGTRRDGAQRAASPLVLPRLMRRPVRFAARLFGGEISAPRHAEAVVFGGTISAAILYGSLTGGQFFTTAETVSASAGFAVKEIEIGGNLYTPVDQIFAALGLDRGRSLIMIDPADARTALAALPWISGAEIRKIYPSKIVITVSERAPFAVWQTGDALSVIESDGSVIGGYAADPSLAALPLFVGKGAATEAKAFQETIAKYSEIAPRVRAHIRVGERRWDLRIDNGMTIRLPEDDVEQALSRLVAMQGEHGVLDLDLAAIDLRIAERTTFALTQNAAAARSEAVETRLKALRESAKGSAI